MPVDIELLNVNDIKAWNDYAKQHDLSMFNCSIQFRFFLIRLFGIGCTPFYLVAKEEGKIVGILPSFVKHGKFGPVLNSLPWFGSNPGVLADSEKIKIMLIQRFCDIARWTNCVSATFISNPFGEDFLYDVFFDEYNQAKLFVDSRIGMITRIPEYTNDEEFDKTVMALVHQKTRNQIKKSIQHGITIEGCDGGDFNWIKNTHSDNMKAIGAPYKEREFEIIKDQLMYGEDYKIFTNVAHENMGNVTMAGLLLKYFNKTVDYMIPALDVNFRHYDPLHVVILDAMRDAAQRGFKYWNWGGTTIPGQEGVYHFKKRFGAEESIYKYYTLIFEPAILRKSKEELLEYYKYFYVVPFQNLESAT